MLSVLGSPGCSLAKTADSDSSPDRSSVSGAYVNAIHSSKNCDSKKRSSKSVLPVAGGAVTGVALLADVMANLAAPNGMASCVQLASVRVACTKHNAA